MTHLEEYTWLIDHKEVVVGYWMRKEIHNLIRDLQDSRWIYDTTEAEKRIRFMEKFCLQSKAPYYIKRGSRLFTRLRTFPLVSVGSSKL